jgi:hypothetical protein
MKVSTIKRPYLLYFRGTSRYYTLSSEEAQRLLDAYPVVSATSRRIVLQGHNTSDPRQRTELIPATRGGGPAFVIDK